MKNLHRHVPKPLFKNLRATAAKLHLIQDFERHCSKTALDEKKRSFAVVALKILKSHLGACRNSRLTMFLRSVRNFSIEDGVKRPGLLKESSKHQKSKIISITIMISVGFLGGVFLSDTAVKPHLTRKSAVSLQWRSKS